MQIINKLLKKNISSKPNCFDKNLCSPNIETYKALCTEYYELDKPNAPEDALLCYLNYADQAKGPILEPMCGTGRFLIPLLKKGYDVTGFDSSPYMLNICKEKLNNIGIKEKVFEATFETFLSNQLYKLIFIPSSSFCLLTENKQVHQALIFISKSLENSGKFIFEIDTLKSKSQNQSKWHSSSIEKSDGIKLVLNIFPTFDPTTKIENTLSHYELWKNNVILKTEVENFRVRLYDMQEIEELLEQYNFKIINKWRPYTKDKPNSNDISILYECALY